jgi:hypothetical protein
MNSLDAKQEAEDLANLVKSPGWQRFCRAVTIDAGQHVEQEMARALDNANDAIAAGKMRQVIASKRWLERALCWPDEQLRKLAPKDQTTTLHRGGL